jgi:uncharacterized protein YjcR
VQPEYPTDYVVMIAVTQMLGIGFPETIHSWIRRDQVDAGTGPVS